ncbi:hypothetical protein Dda_3175 [Drechslerella dactyloides]|uniref:CFEM domain-containing protein n=1 Tax=Drechslerella dactyloides TaxID=74499 RepID=A0AAD6J239_DREDA|nr:hypothetical protein Dda_3175 [Drechslerella dactyloides]
MDKMKFSAVVLVAAAAVASAQSIADIPQCAQTCLIGALGKTGCELTDFKCSCTNKDFVEGGAACIDKACDDASIAKARAATIAICGKAGITIDPPQKGGDKPVSSAPAAPASSSAAPAVSSAPAAPVVSSAAPAVSSSAAPVAPGYGSVTTSKASSAAATTVRPSVIPGNGTVPQQPPTYTGAAAAIAGNAVLAIGGAVAAFFL